MPSRVFSRLRSAHALRWSPSPRRSRRNVEGDPGAGSGYAIFDFPIVTPGSSLLREYVTGVQGLYEFTWDADAPAGFVNSGVFMVSAELWDNDPLTGGQFFAALPDFVLPYEVRVPVPPPTTVPEPTTLLLFSSGIVIAGWSRRRRLV